ncbi:MAG: HEAT repeat domain-containing protein [Akkermansiaceae bacterium]|nr:HEAT repeat domain-containing protein [Akkermansiaceae bacterium]
MKILPSLYIFLGLASSLFALDAAGLAGVAAKFSDPSGDAQYAARAELNRMIDQATAPGVAESAAAIAAVVEILAKPETPAEAKKYLLRALARVGSAESVPAAIALFQGPDAMLQEEARQVLGSLNDPKAIAALTESIKSASSPQEQIALLDSLAHLRSTAAVPAIAAMITKPDAALALAAIDALGRIGGPEVIQGLGKLRSSTTLTEPIKLEIDRALLFAAKGEDKVARKIYQTTASPEVKLQAFLVLSQAGSAAEIIRDAMKSNDADLRLAALKRGLETNQAELLQGGLDRSTDPFSSSERLLILNHLPSLQPADAAAEIAIGALKSEDAEQRAAAISALGLLGGKAAFDALLPLLAEGEPTISRAVSQAIARINAPGADESLLAAIQGPAGPAKQLAIKAAASRSLPGVLPMLVNLIQGPEKDAAQEAMRSLYAIGGIDELKTLCAASQAATDAQVRSSLGSFCKRLASRLGTDEAKQLAESLKAD